MVEGEERRTSQNRYKHKKGVVYRRWWLPLVTKPFVVDVAEPCVNDDKLRRNWLQNEVWIT